MKNWLKGQEPGFSKQMMHRSTGTISGRAPRRLPFTIAAIPARPARISIAMGKLTPYNTKVNERLPNERSCSLGEKRTKCLRRYWLGLR